MSVEIYHNPKCSKSRQTLSLLEGRGIQPRVRLYLENSPSRGELEEVLQKLKLEPIELLRTGEALYKELVNENGKPDNKTALKWMVQHPKLIQRPIVIKGSRAKIGRPPEDILEIL